MSDAGYVFGGWALTIVAIGGYALNLLVRLRRAEGGAGSDTDSSKDLPS